MRKYAIVLVDVERDQSTDRGDTVERVQEESLMFQGAPPRLDHGVVSEKSIVLSWAVLEWSCSPTDKEMYPFRVVDQFPGPKQI